MPEQTSPAPPPGEAGGDSPEEAEGISLSHEEQGEVQHKRPPRVAVLHETIRLEGELELSRGIPALAWSAVAAGLSMGFSMLARGLLQRHAGALPGGVLIESLGYPFGFLVVILARQQLFTENTMTAVLPLMTHPGVRTLGKLLRLWTVVFLGNLVGTAIFAFGLLHMHLFDEATRLALVRIGEEIMANTSLQMFTKAIVAGWLIATMVWLIPAAEQARITVIVLTTYLVALGGFTHVIVGSAEVLYLTFAGVYGFGDYLVHFMLPALAGNIVGGSGIFALISHAQVRSDQAEQEERMAHRRPIRR